MTPLDSPPASRRPEESPPSSSDVLAQAAQNRQTRTRIVVALVGAVVVAGGVGVAVMTTRGAQAATQKAWNDLSACTLGGPLAANERASSRARAIQLVVLGIPEEKRVSTNDVGWPGRCAGYASAVAEALQQNDDKQPLLASATKLADALKVGPSNPTLGSALDDAWRDADKMKLVAQPGSAVTAPPKPAHAIAVDSLPLGSKLLSQGFSLSSLHTEFSAGQTLRFLIDEKDTKEGPTLCEMAPKEKSLRCKAIPAPAAKMSPALRLWGTTEEGAAPLVFVGDHGRDGIYRSDTGALVENKLTYGAYGIHARKDGSYAMLIWKEPAPETKLETVSAGGKRTDIGLFDREKTGNPYYNSGLFWNFVVNKAYAPGEDGLRLFVRTLSDDGSISPPVDVGEVGQPSLVEGGDEPPHIRACRSADTSVIRVKGESAEYLSFFAGGKWTQPVEADTMGGDLACRGNEALLTGVDIETEKRGEVFRTRCDVTSCKSDVVKLADLFAHNDDMWPASVNAIYAADVAGKVAVIWQTQLGGVRLRVAPADQLAKTDDVVVFDDRMQDGILKPESTLLGMNLLTQGDTTLLFLRTVPGVFVFRIEESGGITPVPIGT